MFNTLLEAFNEDRSMITAQFNNLSENAENDMLPLHFDAALIRFRKMLNEAVQSEKNTLLQTS
jgi:vanillate O-demethylase monooxygenase subunit